MNNEFIITRDFIQRNFNRNNITTLSNLTFKTLDEDGLNKFLLKAKLIGYEIIIIEDGESYITYNNTNIIVISKNRFKIIDGEKLFADSIFNSIDLSKVDISKAFTLNKMFEGCNIKNITLNDIHITSENCNLSYMFDKAKINKLEIIDFSTNTINAINLTGMFNESHIKELTIKNFIHSQVNKKSSGRACGLFNDSEIDKLTIENFDTSNITNMSLMFDSAKIPEINLKNFDTSSVDDMYCMFSDCTSNIIDLSSFIINNYCDIEAMFTGCIASVRLPQDKISAKKIQAEIERTVNHVRII